MKELRLAQIGDIGAGNNFLPSFVERFNERFAVLPAKTEDLHRRLNVKASRLADILCHREQRHVGHPDEQKLENAAADSHGKPSLHAAEGGATEFPESRLVPRQTRRSLTPAGSPY